MRPMLAVLGIALILTGLAAIPSSKWVSWVDVLAGLAAVGEFALLPNGAPRALFWGAASIGAVLVASWVLVLAINPVTWPGWWNLAFAAALFMTASGPRTA